MSEQRVLGLNHAISFGSAGDTSPIPKSLNALLLITHYFLIYLRIRNYTMIDINGNLLIAKSDRELFLVPRMSNRHGPVAGAPVQERPSPFNLWQKLQ